MTDRSENVILKAIREVDEKREQEIIDETEDNVKRTIAKNLKGLHSPEEIAKLTGLSLSTILLL